MGKRAAREAIKSSTRATEAGITKVKIETIKTRPAKKYLKLKIFTEIIANAKQKIK